jgi:predicted RNase H-like HicB family nuclease
MNKENHTYTVIVHNAEEDETGYWAEVVELPGCFGAGETLEEIEQDIKDAIETYIIYLKDEGKPVPEGVQCADEERRWYVAVSA